MTNLRQRLVTDFRYLLFNARLRRRILWSCAGLVAFGVLWIFVTALLARQETRKIEASLAQVSSYVAQGRIADARAVAAQIGGEVKRVHLLTSGPAWWFGAEVPYLGSPLDSIRGSSAAGLRVAQRGVPDLLDVATLMDPHTLRRSGDTIDVAALGAAAPRLDDASAVLHAALNQVLHTPSSTWLGAVDRPRNVLAVQLNSLAGYVDAAARAAHILPIMLGDSAPKRYFIGMQNEAELRGTGGLPGAFAIAVISHGKVSFTHFESDAALEPRATHQLVPTGLSFGKGYDDAYGISEPTQSFVNSNVSPNFPYAAQIWAAMWEKVSGEHVDGAIALDPTVLAYVLSVTGPVILPDGSSVTADNIVTLTQRDEYALFSDNLARKQYLVDILHASAQKMTSGAGSATELAQALVLSAKEHRLQVWSADPSVEQALVATSYASVIPSGNRPLAAPILNNGSGGKLDFYLVRTMTYHRTGCDPLRDVLVTITLTNNAPAAGLSPYVTDRLDRGAPADAVPGDYKELLDYYASPGAELLSATLNQQPTTVAVDADLGHPIFRMVLELKRGQTQTVFLHLVEPAGTGAPIIWQQPGVTAMATQVYSQPCG